MNFTIISNSCHFENLILSILHLIGESGLFKLPKLPAPPNSSPRSVLKQSGSQLIFVNNQSLPDDINCIKLCEIRGKKKKTENTWCLKLVIMTHTHPLLRMQLHFLCTTNALITGQKVKK
jgi:hypothetical protein